MTDAPVERPDCPKCGGRGFTLLSRPRPGSPSGNQKVACDCAPPVERSEGAKALVSQGVCDTTLTERFEYDECSCGTYPENAGPCLTFSEGASGRCAYCEHGRDCHLAVLQATLTTALAEKEKLAARFTALEGVAASALATMVSLNALISPLNQDVFGTDGSEDGRYSWPVKDEVMNGIAHDTELLKAALAQGQPATEKT